MGGAVFGKPGSAHPTKLNITLSFRTCFLGAESAFIWRNEKADPSQKRLGMTVEI
jgi:hypothetical protein